VARLKGWSSTGVEGELAADFLELEQKVRQRLPGKRGVALARVLEACRLCLAHPLSGRKSNPEVDAAVLHAASGILRVLAVPNSSHPLPGEIGYLAAPIVGGLMAKLQAGNTPEQLAVFIEYERHNLRAESIFPDGTSSKRISRWTRIIRDVLRDEKHDFVRTAGDLVPVIFDPRTAHYEKLKSIARRILTDCAAATGCKRPSRLWDRERRQSRRQYRN